MIFYKNIHKAAVKDILCFVQLWSGYATLLQSTTTPKMPFTAALYCVEFN